MNKRKGRRLIRGLVLVAVALAAILAGFLCLRDRDAPKGGSPSTHGPAMVFSREGIAGEIISAVGDVVSPERTRAAVHVTETGARWVCVLVQDELRHCTFDDDWTLSRFPALSESGFRAPPHGPARTHSIYLSLARKVIGHNRERGDRVMVVTCPEDEWREMELYWPAEGKTP